MPVLGSPQAGMMPAPCREGGGGRRSEEAGDAGLETRKTETRGHTGWRHADRRPGSTQDGDTGARRTETRGHAERRHRSTQDGDTGARRTETAGTRRRKWTRNRQNCGKSGSPPYPTSSRNSARCVHYKQKARSQKRPGPVLTYGAATLRRQQAPRLRLPTHTTSNRCTHRQARHMQQAQRRQAPKRLPAPRRARA